MFPNFHAGLLYSHLHTTKVFQRVLRKQHVDLSSAKSPTPSPQVASEQGAASVKDSQEARENFRKTLETIMSSTSKIKRDVPAQRLSCKTLFSPMCLRRESSAAFSFTFHRQESFLMWR